MNTLDMLFHVFFVYRSATVGASGFFMHYRLRLNCRVLSGFVLNSLGFVFKHLRALGTFDMKPAVVKSGGVLLTIPKVCEENLWAERAPSPNRMVTLPVLGVTFHVRFVTNLVMDEKQFSTKQTLFFVFSS